MKQITIEELKDYFNPGTFEFIRDKLETPGVSGLVVFQNVQLDSSHLGDASALMIGPGCTYKTPEEVDGQHLNDLPSMRQYPQGYYLKPSGPGSQNAKVKGGKHGKDNN